MATVSPTIESVATELRAALLAGSLAGFGRITLAAGACPDAELAGKVLLADLDHLQHLREHTGSEASPERWAAVSIDMRTLLEVCRARRDAATADATSRTA